MKTNVQKILKWYAENRRLLPWRKPDISAYEVWVSEIMLQQTQVLRVVLYYERFLKRFPTVQKLSRSTWEEFLPYYEGLGYYARGRNMLETARIIVYDFGGKFPKDKRTLMELPGIGEYTASAILSFAYHEREIAYDTNFQKIFGTKEKAEIAFKKSGAASHIFNSAVMDYASAMKSVKSKVCKVLPPAILHRVVLGKKHRTTLCKTYIVLHENHKKYFSENRKRYEPFVLEEGVSSRRAIKKHFLEKYDLRVSVRPPKNGRINAQILLGAPRFAIYSKKDYDAYHDGFTQN